jgi:hypothetical protein
MSNNKPQLNAQFIRRYHEKRSILEVLNDRNVVIEGGAYSSLNELTEAANEAYEIGDVNRILQFEGIVKSIQMMCNSFKPKIEKTPFTYNEYLSARLGGMSHEDIGSDEEIRQHYDFSEINRRKLHAYNLSASRLIKKI